MNFFYNLHPRFFFLVILTALAATLPRSVFAFTLVKNGRPACTALFGIKTSPMEQRAEAELINALERISGARIPIIHKETIPETGNVILFGKGPWFSSSRFSQSAETLDIVGKQGYVISTVWNGKSECLAVAGGSPLAMQYAVRELLRKTGTQWYVPDEIRTPRRKTIEFPSKEIADFPCFFYRGIDSGGWSDSPEWKDYLRLNARPVKPLGLSGFETEYIPLEIAFGSLLSGELFSEHPEFFPLISGERSNAYGLCCFSNPQATALAAGGIIARLDQSPEATHVIIRFGPPRAICRCPVCEQTIRREGETGLALSWVNTVAELIARRRRNVYLTFSEPWTLGPAPKTIRPSENTAVLLNAVNYAGKQDFENAARQWSAVSDRVHLGIPLIPKEGDLLPFRGLFHLAEDLVRYRDYDVEGIFFKPPMNGMLVADAELRMWTLSELLWNSGLDVDPLIREWLKGGCGAAAASLTDYYEHVAKLGGKSSTAQEGLSSIDNVWLDSAERILQRAFARSLTDKPANRQVRRLRLGIWRLRLEKVCDSVRNGESLNAAAHGKHLEMLQKLEQGFRDFGYDRISSEETISDFSHRIRAVLQEGLRR